GHPRAAARLANIIHIAQEAYVEFIYYSGSQHLGIAHRNHLRLADGESVETGYAGATLALRVGTVEPVIIDEIIAGDLAESRVGVDPAAGLIVSDGLGICRGRKEIRSDIRRGNIWQQVRGRGGPRAR